MPRIRLDGGLIGVTNNPSANGAGGLWSFYEHSKYQRSSIWPAASPPAGSVNATALIVAGGGGGGHDFGGGGGAGGLISNTVTLINILNYTITVGAGGAGPTSYGALPSVGSNTTAFGYTAVGGGGGAGTATPSYAATSGGSGGGAAGNGGNGGTNARALGTAGQGNDGGTATGASGSSTASGGGGGGGAGAAGTNATRAQAGNGGAGIYSSISGSNTAYAGGGGGGGYSPYSSLAGTGGAGGGGSGNTASNGSGAPGTAYTGGGGGGGAGGGTGTNSAGSGGSGVVIINYPAPQQYTGGTVTNVNNLAGSNIVHTFTTSGSLNALGYSIDTYFPQTTLLLHGNGTVGANNTVFLDNSGANTYIPFNGTYSTYLNASSYLISAANASNQLTGDFTIECWVGYVSNIASGPGLINITNTSSSGSNGLSLYLTSAGAVGFFVNGNGTNTVSANGLITSNGWYHIALVRSGSTNTLYVNGVSVASSSTTPTWPSTPSIGIGRTYNDNTGFVLNGYLSNIRILKGTALYTSSFTPPTSSLSAISNTYLLTCQSPFIVDNSTNNLTITQTGNPLISSGGVPVAANGKPQQGTFSPFSQTGWSNYFNASTSDKITCGSNVAALGTGNFTIEFWAFSTAASTNYSSFLEASAGQLFFRTTPSNILEYGILGSYGNNSASAIMPLNQWAHIALVRSGTTITMYINGISVATFTDSTSFPAASYSITGTSNGSGTNRYISNLRITNTAVYTSNFTPPISPLTAISGTLLLTCQDNRFKDNSSSNITLTTSGTPSVQPFSPFSPTAAYSNTVVGGSVYFNGSSDYLSTPSPGTNFQFGTSNWTIEAWVYPTSTNATQTVYQIYGTTNDNINIQFNGTTKAFFTDIRGTNQVQVTATSTVLANLNQWNHVVLTRDSTTTVKLYVNGALGATQAISATTTFVDTQFTSNPTVGVKTNTLANYFAGYISNLRVVNGTAVYTGAFTPPSTPLTATQSSGTNISAIASGTVKLLNATNAGIIDHTAKNTLTTYGSAAISSTQSKFGGTSMYFDGSTSVITAPYVSSLHSFHLSDYTVELWVYPLSYAGMSQGASALPTLIGGMLYNNNTSDWSFGMNTSGILKFTYWNGTATQSVTSSTTVPLNSWSHIAAVKTSSGISLYYNGTLAVGPTALSGTPSIQAGTFLTLGAYNNTYCNAYVDDVRISKFARYTSNFTPPTSAFLDR